MADIRQYPGNILDDFNRPTEDPALPPWRRDFGDWVDCKVLGGGFWGTQVPTVGSFMYWDNGTGPLPTAPLIECWAKAGAYTPALADGHRLGLITKGAAPNGYVVLAQFQVFGEVWILRRYDGGGITSLASQESLALGGNRWCVMWLTPTSVEVYMSTTSDPEGSWTLKVSAADATYRDDLYPALGHTGIDTDWRLFGAGPVRRTQIYRWVRAPARIGVA